MAPRANWKGFLKIGALTCPVALHSAVSTSDRIAFHTLNRTTGHRINRRFVDGETGNLVEREDQIKGYEVASGDYIMLEPEEIAAAVPESDKTLAVSAFIPARDIDDIYFDKPYYLAPSGHHAEEAFILIREGMRMNNVAALAQAVLFRRVRNVMIRPEGAGLIATTLNFDYEVSSAKQVFEGVPDIKIKGEMLELAEHIILTKKGKFDPARFTDRYEAALAELVKAKIEGRRIEVRKEPKPDKVIDLMAALRESAKISPARRPARQKKPVKTEKARQTRRKAG